MNSLELTLKLLIKDAICEALDEYTTRIRPANEPAVPSTAEPGTKKRRAGRNEASENPTANLEDDKQSQSAPADPAAEYKKIQAIVVALVNQDGGKEKVVKVLNHFGVPTALKLSPDQYPKALAMLEAVSQEEALA